MESQVLLFVVEYNMYNACVRVQTFFRRTRHASKTCVVHTFFVLTPRIRSPKIFSWIKTVGSPREANLSHLQTAFVVSAPEINILQHFPYEKPQALTTGTIGATRGPLVVTQTLESIV